VSESWLKPNVDSNKHPFLPSLPANGLHQPHSYLYIHQYTVTSRIVSPTSKSVFISPTDTPSSRSTTSTSIPPPICWFTYPILPPPHCSDIQFPLYPTFFRSASKSTIHPTTSWLASPVQHLTRLSAVPAVKIFRDIQPNFTPQSTITVDPAVSIRRVRVVQGAFSSEPMCKSQICFYGVYGTFSK